METKWMCLDLLLDIYPPVFDGAPGNRLLVEIAELLGLYHHKDRRDLAGRTAPISKYGHTIVKFPFYGLQ